ncbi:MAG TPA: lysylphosphatidylglycerol synthase transmembrane domain-containing protein [Chthoniobacteraceae bacterium]|nr:lysylphosphatidylglycerol synthase transmembrane domain-containing protein [Chthoniobacteraceae bacterium]
MKKTLVTLLQAAVTIGILAWLFRNPETNRQMWAALTQAHTGWIVLAALAFGVAEIFGVARWRLLLKVQGITVGWLRLLGLVLIGLFFNVFMPGGTGGDVVKIFYLLKETPGRKPAAVLAAMVDRIVGLMALILLAAVVIVLRYDWLTSTPVTSGLLYTLMTIFGSALAFVFISFGLTASGLVHRLPARLPLREKLIEMSVAYRLYARAWRSTLAALLISLPVHFLSFVQFYFVARAFSAAAGKVSLLDFSALMPIVNTLTAMPISIGGAGLREGLFVRLLGDLCGIDAATATVISLTGYLVIALGGLVGGVIYLCYRPSNAGRGVSSGGEDATVQGSPFGPSEVPSK